MKNFLYLFFRTNKKIKLKVIGKIRNLYSHDLIPDKIFLGFLKIDYFLSKNNIKITQDSKEIYKFSEKSKYSNELFDWYVSSKIRRRCVQSFANGIQSLGERISENYGLNLINFEDNDIVIDCGANLGALWLYLNSLDIKLIYICIEPGNQEFLGLKKSIQRFYKSKIKTILVNKALSNGEGEIKFYYSPNNADSSIIKIDNYEKVEIINTTSLDKLIRDLKIDNKKIKLLKLEAEGAEPEVINGAKKTLANFNYIAADLGPERGFKEECTIKEVSNTLYQNNYKMIDFRYPRICCLYEKSQ